MKNDIEIVSETLDDDVIMQNVVAFRNYVLQT